MPSPKAFAKILVLAGLVAAAPPGSYAALLQAIDNVHEVAPGMLHRSGQLSASELRRLGRGRRDQNRPEPAGRASRHPLYDAESAAARGLGIRYVSIGISAGAVPTMVTMTEIADVLRDAPGPILVHCEGGADRSGLASAIYELAVAGKHADHAAEQLSLRYLHFPYFGSRTAAMDDAFALFASNWSPAPISPSGPLRTDRIDRRRRRYGRPGQSLSACRRLRTDRDVRLETTAGFMNGLPPITPSADVSSDA